MRVALTLAFLFAGPYLLVNYNRYRIRAADGGIQAPNGAQTDASAADKQKLQGVWRAARAERQGKAVLQAAYSGEPTGAK